MKSMWVCKRCCADQSPGEPKHTILGDTPYCGSCRDFFDYSGTLDLPTPTPEQNVLEEAAGLIYGDRQQQYGNARDNFGDIADLWLVVLKDCVVNGELRLSAEAVAICLLLLKVARAKNDIVNDRPIKRDTTVDLAGYAGCIEKIQKGV
jgi:hypothetical protein